jgi:hypothetical protein
MDDGLCCQTCKREDADEDKEKIARCPDVPECEEGEVPVRPESKGKRGDKQCPTCKKGKATCATGCGDNQICVTKNKGKSGESTKCVGKKGRAFMFKAKDALAEVLKEATEEVTEEQVRAILVEMVERYCDQAANSEECALSKSEVIEGMLVKVLAKVTKGAKEEDLEVEVEIPETTTERRRLLTDSGTLLDNAIADSDVDDLQVVGVESGAAVATPVALAAAATLAAMFVIY